MAAFSRDEVLKRVSEGSSLERADLREIQLEGACLGGANLARADLTGANLASADLRGAILSAPVISGNRIMFGTSKYLFYVLEEIF